MDTLNAAMCTALRDLMRECGVSQADVARHLDRTADYVSGRLRGRYTLSVDIITAAAALMGVSGHALMADMVERMAETGQGSSPR